MRYYCKVTAIRKMRLVEKDITPYVKHIMVETAYKLEQLQFGMGELPVS